MKTPAQIRNHPIHPMMVSFPIGLWIFSLVMDIMYLTTKDLVWRVVAAYTLGGGLIGAGFAAVPGIIDYFVITGPRAKKIATWHMVANISLVLLYGLNFFLRYQRQYDSAGLPFVLSLVGAVILGVSGWLGGELVYVHKMGVKEGDN